MSRLPSSKKETLFNEVIKVICQGVLASKEEVPIVECVLLAQDTAIDIDDVDTNTSSDLSQVDWPAEQTIDATIHRVDNCSPLDINLPSNRLQLSQIPVKSI